MARFRILLIILLVNRLPASAQQELKGIVSMTGTDIPLQNVTVKNQRTRQISYSGRTGAYGIPAAENDTVVFSNLGFLNDTLVVSFDMLLTSRDVWLRTDTVALAGVTVSSRYHADSLARRQAYEELVSQMRGITGGNRPTDGVGISISLSNLKKNKQQRAAKKRMDQMEKEFLIDDRFPAAYVANLTKLKGDSLYQFLYRYRPSYKEARKLDRTGLIDYVNTKLIEYRKPDQD